ncbi:hypothetical protein WN944_002579 [Citrus x changshan-huyou]|uniref:Secreted protein n=1 Tax=Citrus x changshan-huyou TaxID=2935761 RepID=A0AAP0MGU7_9ROSI
MIGARRNSTARQACELIGGFYLLQCLLTVSFCIPEDQMAEVCSTELMARSKTLSGTRSHVGYDPVVVACSRSCY